MFPRLRETLGTALDLVVEFSTLGEYRLDATGVPAPASALAAALEPTPRRGGMGPVADVVAERIVAGGAAASRTPRAPAATPAARRAQLARPANRSTASARKPSASMPARGTSTLRGNASAGACDGARDHASRERSATTPARRTRSGAPVAAEQLCFADV